MKEEKIMIVDDEKDIVDFVVAYLAKEGYPTIEAYDGETALKLWREHRPDLVVLDILMPHLDGLSFCREVRKDSNIPIIILSAKSGEDDRIARPGDRGRRLHDQTLQPQGAGGQDQGGTAQAQGELVEEGFVDRGAHGHRYRQPPGEGKR